MTAKRRTSKFDRANLVARRIVRVQKNYLGGWAVTIDGWFIHGYDTFKTKKDAERGRVIVVQHFDVALYNAGVKP